MSSAEQYQLYANAAPDQSGHDVILHTLDTWRSHTNQDGVSRKLFFGSGNFTGTESLWNGTPLIFGTRHPKTLRVPRVYGDEPRYTNQNRELSTSSPCVWGWTVRKESVGLLCGEFPVWMEMNRTPS